MAPRRPRNTVTLEAVLAMRITNPKISLRAIGAPLQVMQIPWRGKKWLRLR